MNFDQHLTKLMHLCFDMIQSEARKDIARGDEWKNDAQTLGTKIFRHIASAQQISEGLQFDFGNENKFQYIDHSSVVVVTRAAIEAFLTFHYIFINQDTKLTLFRHKTWQLAGLTDRSKLFANTSEAREVLRSEAEEITKLKKEIHESEFYQNGNKDFRKTIDNGSWKPKGGLFTISDAADIHQQYFSDIYNNYSGHAHASYISALQIRDAFRIEDQEMLAGGARQNLCLTLAHFLFAYSKIFPNSRKILESDSELFDLANTWYIQKNHVEFIYGKSPKN
ncbi:DUF5677 domain-containing protein [Pseudomonas sp. JAI120]|uniref:DUF5677 domain-containing protein n=1 Tax=Pseudomonas sp. JAI120 TaxID=2723063 RepID=UPI0030ED3960